MPDFRIGADRPTPTERAAVAAVVGGRTATVLDGERLARGGLHAVHELRHLLLPALHALQAAAGWISPGAVNHLAATLGVAPAEIHGVATFYDLFATTPPADDGPVVRVCVDPACLVAGGAELARRLEAEGRRVVTGPCLGRCEQAPARWVQIRRAPADGGAAGRVPTDPDDPTDRGRAPVPQAGSPDLRLLGRLAGRDPIDPTSLADHEARGGWRALRHAVERGPDAVVDDLIAAGLTGRGGAGFPTGRKWRAVREARAPRRHLVVNVDESEPGTFKDRVLVTHDPHQLVEAALLAAWVTGAERGWFYVRGEYPLTAERLADALDACRSAGWLGGDVGGLGFAFDAEVRQGAGAYVCGEETALIASLEGFRGEPRVKPPYPTERGLFGEPTVVNNPETLVAALDIVREGAGNVAGGGSARNGRPAPATKLFSVAGRVADPGVVEVPVGTTLGELLEITGGATGEPGPILLGGAAGSFVGPDELDLPLTPAAAAAAGATLGSGAVTVFSADDDMAAVVERIAAFFRHESCGRCVPCRIGTVRQHEALLDLAGGGSPGAGSPGGSSAGPHAGSLADLDAVMSDASICGLGQTAASAVRSALARGLLD